MKEKPVFYVVNKYISLKNNRFLCSKPPVVLLNKHVRGRSMTEDGKKGISRLKLTDSCQCPLSLSLLHIPSIIVSCRHCVLMHVWCRLVTLERTHLRKDYMGRINRNSLKAVSVKKFPSSIQFRFKRTSLPYCCTIVCKNSHMLHFLPH